MPKQSKRLYEFGPFSLDSEERVLRREDETVSLTPKALETLLVLVQHRGHIVERDDLIKKVWPNAFVEEGNLSVHISALRKVLGEGLADQPYIETVPRQGYRFTASVREVEDESQDLIVEKRSRSRVVIEEEEVGVDEEEAKTVRAATTPGLLPPAVEIEGRAKRLSVFTVLAITLVAGCLTIALYYLLNARKQDGSAGVTAIKSIAVLPFKPLNAAGAEDEYFELGMSDALTTKLGALKQVAVRPTSAVLRYRDAAQDPLAAGRALGVEAVLDGHVQRAGDRIRVTVQLVSVRDGAELWAGKFDDESSNVFAVQDSISEQVARALKLDLGGQEQRLPARRPTENAEAYKLYLLGRYWWNKRDESNIKAAAYYQQAIVLDPNFALAYAALADSYAFHSYDSQDWRRGEDAARKALEIDPTLAEAHASLGFIAMFHRWDWAAAEKEFQQSIEFNPNYATVHQWYATLHEIRKEWPEAHVELERALEIDPVSLPLNADRCELLYFERRYDEAVGQCRRVLEMDANFQLADEHLQHIYSKLGKDAEAMGEYFKARGTSAAVARETPEMRAFASTGVRGFWQAAISPLKPSPDQPNADYYVALYYTLLGDKKQALYHLDRAYDNHDFLLPFVDAEPLFDDLRSDSRFQTFLRRMDLAS